MKLKVLSFNIHKGFNWNNTVPTLDKLKTFLIRENPDIVFLQEVVGENEIFSKKFSHWMSNQLEFLADSIWTEHAYAKNAIYDGRHHGNVILSKYPILNQKQVNISTNKYEQRGVLHCEIDVQGKMIHCYNVHLNLTHSGRKKQYQSLKKIILESNTQDDPVILAGDFNDWNKRACNSLVDDLQLIEAYKGMHADYAKTFPAIYPLFPLDRIYTKHFKVTAADVPNCILAKNLSDHLPISMECELL